MKSRRNKVLRGIESAIRGCSLALILALAPLALGQSPIDVALETDNAEWESNGGWELQQTESADGVDALESVPLNDNESAVLALTLEGPLTGSFWWKVSSEEEFDGVYLAIDQEVVAFISGEVDWTEEAFELGPGSHELLWVYEKDESGAGGRDRAWLDFFSLGEEPEPQPLRITTQPKALSVGVGQTAALSVVAEASEAIQYQWFKGETAIDGATQATLTLTDVRESDAGDYTVLVGTESEELQSETVMLTVTANPSPSEPGSGNGGGSTWTILVYGHGDHNLSTSLLRDMLEMEQLGSSDGFNIVLQADFNAGDRDFTRLATDWGLERSLHTGISRYLMGGDTDGDAWTLNSKPIQRLPESMNMDEVSTLKDFLNWGIQSYPADRYGVVFWNHGGQWEGFGGDTQDGTTHTDGLSTAVIRKAVKETMAARSLAKLDFVAFDTCLMGGAEVLVDFVDITDLFIANAELDYGDGLDYGAELKLLRDDPTMDIFEFGRREIPVWDAHHQTDVDQALKVHATFDLRKFGTFSQSFNEFSKQLLDIMPGGAVLIQSLQRQTVHYNVSNVSEINKPTDYIDLGEFADKIAAHSAAPDSLRAAAVAVSRTIDEMVVGMTAGTKREGKVHGLSVYYPNSGVNDQNVYLDLAFNALPNSVWQNFLGSVASSAGADSQGPSILVASSGSARKGGSNDRGSSDLIYVGSLDDPASLVFSLAEANDAYGFYSALVSNQETGNPDEYVYLGEIANGLADGPGDYELLWDTTMLTISASDDDAKPYLGGWFQEPGSDILISYADYTAPGAEEAIEVVLLTRANDEGGEIIQVMDSAENTLSAVADVTLEAGGKLTPVYYTELRTGNPDEWEAYEIFYEESFIVIPEGGFSAIKVEYTPVFLGEYSVEILTTDVFDNESDILTYPVVVVEDIAELPVNPRLRIALQGMNQVQVSWPAIDAVNFRLQGKSDLSGEWLDISNDLIEFNEAAGTESASFEVGGAPQFFRLFKP